MNQNEKDRYLYFCELIDKNGGNEIFRRAIPHPLLLGNSRNTTMVNVPHFVINRLETAEALFDEWMKKSNMRGILENC